MESSVKGWLSIGAGIGAGGVLMLALIAAGVNWYGSRPQAWETSAITSSFSADLYNVDDAFNVTSVELEYIVHNHTAKDYTVSPESKFMIADKDALGPSVTGHYGVASPCFVPARTKVKCSILVALDYDTSMPGVDGFVVFDPLNRYKIIFPKPLRPSPEQRKKTTEHFRELQRAGATHTLQ